jgi:hypothetical protein
MNSNPPRDTRFHALADRLGSYARFALERSFGLARRMHAEELSPEHVLASLLLDEECGATRLILYAFADPATLGIEVTALCSGIMIVRSSGSLPFSVRALEALRGAHGEAAERHQPDQPYAIAPVDVASAAWRVLPDEVRPHLKALGEIAGTAPSTKRPTEKVPLFAAFDAGARRTLGRAAKAATEFRRDCISPAHLILGALEADESLREQTALTPAALRFAFHGVDDDPTPLRTGPIAVARELFELFDPLPDGADTAALLGRYLSHGSEEVRALLVRQKVTPALFQRAGTSFPDPKPPA